MGDLEEDEELQVPIKVREGVDEEEIEEVQQQRRRMRHFCGPVNPLEWVSMLCRELNATFVLGVVLVYGLSQGFSGSFFKVVSDYYWKDVQKAQPSAVQIYITLYYIPWVMKPLWGLLTDVFPLFGYRRRPYFVFAGLLGTATSVALSTNGELPVYAALVCLVGMTASVAIADVTIDACIARNSIDHPDLAADIQSLCGFVSSIGAFVGYSSSGVVLRAVGAQGALGLMAMPATLLVLLGFIIFELRVSARQSEITKVDRPSLYISLPFFPNPKLTVVCAWRKTSGDGEIVWGIEWDVAHDKFTASVEAVPVHVSFACPEHQHPRGTILLEFVGMVHAIGAMASIVGVVIYHKLLRGYRFRRLLFCAQLLYGISGLLDLIFILRWNLRLGMPDSFFVIFEECCSRIVGRIRWMPMMVLSARLCPSGIEGTFFALLMCIDSLGSLTSKAAGAVVLQAFHVTRTDFRHLWLVALIRNLLRLTTLALIFLLPDIDQSEAILPPHLVVAPTVRHVGDEEEKQRLQLAEVVSFHGDEQES